MIGTYQMQNTIYRLICCSLLLGLSACNDHSNDNANNSAPQKQLSAIETWTLDNQSKQLVQQENMTVKHANQRISEFNIFDDSGADKQWGTADDRAYSRISCQYSGKTPTPIRDPALDFPLPQPFGSTVTGTIRLAVWGIHERSNSLCALDYQQDAKIIEQQFFPKLFEAGKSNPAFYMYTWSAKTDAGVLKGTSTKLSYPFLNNQGNSPDIPACPQNEVCDLLVMGMGNNLYNIDYYDNKLSIDPVRKKIYHYGYQHGRIDRITGFSYEGDVNTAIAQLNTLSASFSSQYHYSNNQIKICSDSGSPQILESYTGQQLVQRDYLDAGADKMTCTSDDVLVKREKYNYQ